ncbi:ABC transporter substrate-binding protein [Xanthobacter aminoxidans]|uniref:ABC transporter substrate-binding protein n=1 Tax=Xanthobacter aminoxidans TaxID=186280 RepID=UPI002022DBD3|nr:ABC transporter substrate-binding protein [Xanthobacter aminoxidans]MCL8385436.1 ABC transporter substrate-binding protein [Xanthobacter aminoxidans]
MSAMFNRRIALAAMAASLLALSAGLAQAQEVLRIGVLGPLTGPGAAWGLGMDGGVKIAAEEVNARGGLKVGATSYKLEVISYDDQYKAAEAVTAINRLIGPDDVRFVFGPIGSASLLAIKPLTEREGVLLFTGAWAADVLKDSKYIFRVGPTTQEFSPSTVAWLKKNRPNLQRVALVAANDETGWNSQKIQKAAYTKGGFDVVAAEFFERSQNDFRALLTKVLAQNPDTIELDTAPPRTAGLIIRQAREQGYKGSFTKFGGYDVEEIVKAAGPEYAQGVVGTTMAAPGTDTWNRLGARFGTLHKTEMNDYVVMFYDAANLLFSSLQKAGSTKSDAVVAALEANTPFQGSVGPLTWGGKAAYSVDHQIYRAVVMVEIQNGKGVVIGEAKPD